MATPFLKIMQYFTYRNVDVFLFVLALKLRKLGNVVSGDDLIKDRSSYEANRKLMINSGANMEMGK